MTAHIYRIRAWSLLLSTLLVVTGPIRAQNKITPIPVPAPAAAASAPMQAVERGLEQLRGIQQPDGSWGAGWKCGMTGLVLRAMLAQNPQPDAVMVKAAEFLIATAKTNPNGIISSKAKDTSHCIYEMALGLDALARFQKAGGKAVALEETVRTAAQYVVSQQGTLGGWSYGGSGPDYVKDREDMSTTWWHYHALQQVVATKMDIKGLPQALKRTEKYIESRREKGGGIGHSSKRGQAYSAYTMTGPALSVLAVNHARESSCGNAARFILTETEKDPPDWKSNANLYTWYGNTLGLKATHQDSFLKWTKLVGPILIANQKDDGTWALETGKFSAGTAAAAGQDSAILRSAFCILMLEEMMAPAVKR